MKENVIAFEYSIEDRVIQLPTALNVIRTAEKVASEHNGKFYIDVPKSETDEAVEVDHQVIQAMKGATLGIYRELCHAGLDHMANAMLGSVNNDRRRTR